MSYQEINSKYISNTRKLHDCEWCGQDIEIGSEAHYRFYVFDGEKQSAYMHSECKRGCEWAYLDKQSDLADGWQPGEYDRGGWMHNEDARYESLSAWRVLASIEIFERLKIGDNVVSGYQPELIKTVANLGVDWVWIGENELIDRQEWVLGAYQKIGSKI